MNTLVREEEIIAKLAEKFPDIAGNFKIVRKRRIFAELPTERFLEVFAYAARDLKFIHLCTITALDEKDSFGFLYHLAQDSGVILNLKINAGKEKPVIKTVTSFFVGADIYEREIMDLFGVKVEGLTPGARYPLPDDWPADEFPLRKDWRPQVDPNDREENHA